MRRLRKHEKGLRPRIYRGFIEENYGGSGLAFLELALIAEEFFRVDAGCGTIIHTTLGTEFVLIFDEDPRRLLHWIQISSVFRSPVCP